MPISNMSVNLCCSDTLMAEHFLNGANISAAHEQVSGKGMSQCMGAYFDWQATSFCIFDDNFLDRPRCQPHFFAVPCSMYSATISNEQRLKMVLAGLQVPPNPLCGCI